MTAGGALPDDEGTNGSLRGLRTKAGSDIRIISDISSALKATYLYVHAQESLLSLICPYEDRHPSLRLFDSYFAFSQA